MTQSNGIDEFGRSERLRQEREDDRGSRSTSVSQTSSGSSRRRSRSEANGPQGEDAPGDVGRTGSESVGRVSGDSGLAEGLAGPGREDQHDVAFRAGAARCSRLNSGVQPSSRRSSKESPPYGVPAGSQGEGFGAGRRESGSRSPRTVLKRFASSSGSCCFGALTFGWQECGAPAEFDVPARSVCTRCDTNDVEEERTGERFCLAHTAILVFTDRIKANLTHEERVDFESERTFSKHRGPEYHCK